MKKILFVIAFICSMATFSNVEASNYEVNDAKIDVLFEKASTTIMMNLTDMSSNLMTSTANFNSSVKAKDPLLAIVLDFFLGGLGIHRFYLGTKVMTGVGYILTCGGIFGHLEHAGQLQVSPLAFCIRTLCTTILCLPVPCASSGDPNRRPLNSSPPVAKLLRICYYGQAWSNGRHQKFIYTCANVQIHVPTSSSMRLPQVHTSRGFPHKLRHE